MSPPKSPFLSERKLRKLRRDPRLFFQDALRKRANAFTDLAIRTATHLPVRGFVKSKRRYTAIAAVYNVEKFLDQFFESMVGQTVSFDDDIELIMVDDGSVDGSAAIIEKWQKKHPNSIRYFHKENGGQASARNVGLAHATGEWVTFVDPDDFLHLRYFEMVDRFLTANEDKPISLLCCKWVFYYDDGGRYVDNHPLNYRFEGGSYAAQHHAQANLMVSSAARSFFRADVLARENVTFDELLRPNFEDGDFTGRYLLKTSDQYIGYVAEAIYYYRKRDDGTSTLDQGWTNPSRFGAVVERGYVGLLREAKASQGVVPISIQRLVLYDVFWLFKRIVDNEPSVSFLTSSQVDAFLSALFDVFEHIDASTIMQFDLAGCWFFHKVGFLGKYKGKTPPYQIVYVEDYDESKHLALLKYFYFGDPVLESFQVDGVDVLPVFAKVRTHDFLGGVFVSERRVQVQLGDGYSTLTAEIGGAPARISLDSAQHERGIARAVLERGVRDRRRTKGRWPDARALRQEAQSPEVRRRFRDAWLLIDRDQAADDNAEHLYRYILKNHPEINAFFVLSETSHDWARLAAEGFRLIAFGSRDHHLLLLNARHVISSHADSFVLRVLPADSYGDLLDFKFTFLQHGVIRDDISSWLNTKKIDLFITSSPREHESIVDDGSLYKFDRKQTKMLGLARHDALVTRTEETERVVVIMPTWRQYLVGGAALGTTQRTASPRFQQSKYARGWRGLLHSARFREMTERFGYRVVFFPHANMQLYVDAFEAPSWVEVKTHATEPVLQKLYRRAAVMITDYSSVFFETALIDKPVLYYQFDRDEMYGGKHPSRLGYFDFERDGFGPVTETEDALLDELEQLLARECAPKEEYLRRMRETLPLRHGQNRARTVEAIKALDEATLTDTQVTEITRAQAEVASRAGAWELAESRWQAVRSADTTDSEATLRLAQAERGLGKTADAETLLAQLEGASDLALRIRIERAEIAKAQGRLERAKAMWTALCQSDLTHEGLDEAHASLALADVHRLAGEVDDARRILESLPESPSRDLARAELAVDRGEWRDAALRFARLAKSSDDAFCLRAARAYQRAGELERATAIVDAYLGGGGTATEATLLCVELLFEQGKVDVAKQRALALADGERAQTRAESLGVARLCARLGLPDVAERVLGAQPPSAALVAARLDVWAAAGRWSEITRVDRRDLSALPPRERWRGELSIARAHREVGVMDAAVKAIEHVRAEVPGWAEALWAHAETLQAAERWAEAAELWKQHLTEHPGREAERVRARLVLALERLGRREEASEILRESARASAIERLQREPDDADAYRQLVQLMTAPPTGSRG